METVESLMRQLHQGKDELERLITKRTNQLEPLKSLENAKNINVSTFYSNLRDEIHSLKMAKMHRENAIKWYGNVMEAIKKKEEESR